MDATGMTKPVTNRTRQRRRQYLINPSFQWKYCFWIMVDVFAVCSFMGLLLFGVLERNLRWRLLHPEASHIAETVLIVVGFSLLLSTVAAVALGLWSVMITHRFCGPLSVIGRSLTELAEGRLPKHRPLRKKDEFKDFHAHYWRTIDALKVAKRTDLATLTEILAAVRSATDADDEARKRALDRAVVHIERMRKVTATALGEGLFQTSDTQTTGHGSTPTPINPRAELPA
jgi:hypothetical protein